ncbi:MAG: 2-dehydro-3-deoxygalactonokinase [Clostridia bacterium]|nr:2-dehydro-3-deoxygalactonokinase [Clostridia bacterium]
MSFYITIDGGTTNTRINLVKDNNVVDAIKINVGAKKGIDGKTLLIAEIKSAIEEVLSKNNLQESNIHRILASGMLTSEFGLCNLEHIKTPAGIKELHNSMYETQLEEISSIPFVFVRGVKTDGNDIASIDIMRGEETELMGIINNEYADCMYVLPGSHSKLIKTDKEGRIIDFTTMLTGEMISALSENTILKDAVDLNGAALDCEYLLKGYDFSKENGFNKALFKVRILKSIFALEKEKIYSFFLGAVLCDEIKEIIKSDAKTIVIGGRNQIKNAMNEILKQKANKVVRIIADSEVDKSVILGIIKIYEEKL